MKEENPTCCKCNSQLRRIRFKHGKYTYICDRCNKIVRLSKQEVLCPKCMSPINIANYHNPFVITCSACGYWNIDYDGNKG